MKELSLYKAALLLAMSALLSISITACSAKEHIRTEESKETQGELDYENLTAQDLIKDLKGKTSLTDEEFFNLLSTFRYVKIDEDKLTLEPNITDEALKLLEDGNVEMQKNDTVLKMLLESEYPQLRGLGYSWLSDKELDTDKSISVEALKKEKDAYPTMQALKNLARYSAENEDIKDFVVAAAKADSPLIRAKVAEELCSGAWSDKVFFEGASDIVLELISDPDAEVVGAAANGCEMFQDTRFLEPLKAIINDDEKVYNHRAAAKGLVGLWIKAYNEEAYNTIIDYIRKTPRTDKLPDWSAIQEVCLISGSDLEKMKENVTFYNSADVVAALTDIVQDPTVLFMEREEAIKGIKLHGGKSALERIGSVVEGLTDDSADNIKTIYRKEMKSE